MQAVGLRGYAQRDPLVEYKLEGYNLFLDMMANIRRNTIYNIYLFQPEKVAKIDLVGRLSDPLHMLSLLPCMQRHW